MVLLTCQVDLHLPESRSLKDKRRVVQSLKERIQSRFNVSVAEVEYQDLWQRCTLAAAVVSTATDHAHQVLDSLVRFVEGDLRVQLLDYIVETH
ncbi:MAG: DUF503 family protein [Candidatus Latescibacteria bacterium]|nr:DUF503 family protein [Candidatus Latescibacterota bacterium]